MHFLQKVDSKIPVVFEEASGDVSVPTILCAKNRTVVELCFFYQTLRFLASFACFTWENVKYTWFKKYV